ncbi:MAG: adenylate/guanylate cyclase domain-containing protein [bacterium]|nr:adenylate/guanylate cyclase domain-containing protein [bacterium]
MTPTPDAASETWRAILMGEYAPLRRGRRFFKLLPSHPRCRFCNAPFGAPGRLISSLLGKRPSRKNPNFCDICSLAMPIGGAEIELSMLFADIRGSTALAENISPLEFSRILNNFYGVATDILVASDALIDKFVGDEVIGLYVPGFAGADHSRRAIESAESLLRATGHGSAGEPWLPIGIGVHTGIAYVGGVGTADGVNDLTALGDAMNTTARLASQAAAGEALVSEKAYAASGLDRGNPEQRYLTLKGRTKPVCIRVLRPAAA